MKRALITLVLTAALLTVGLVAAPPAYAGHCSHQAQDVLRNGSTLWGRGLAYCGSTTTVSAIVCLQRWNGSNWAWANCNQVSNTQLQGGVWTWFYSLADNCSSSTSFRPAMNLYVHGAWQGYNYGVSYDC